MTFADEITRIRSIFIDTAPIIYYIEAHPQFGPLSKEVVDTFQSGALKAFTSVITLVEVLPKPIETGQEWLAKRFADFLRYAKGLTLMEISADMAEVAGKLRGHYPFLRTMDAIQLGVAIKAGADAFLTNDAKLKQIKEIKVLILKDYLL
jgi:predicted nucleic acid-binding protein